MVVHLSFSGKFYGRENAAFSLVKALQERLNVMMLLVIEERAPANDREDLIVKLNSYGIRNEIIYTDKILSTRTFNDLAEKMNCLQAKIIHCHCHKSAFYSLLIRWLNKTNAKVVLTLHGLVLPLSAKSLFHYLLYYASIVFVDGVVGCSKQIVASLLGVPIIKHKVTAIQNGYENFTRIQISKQQAQKELTTICGNVAGKLLIANVGRLTLQKNPMFFLRIVKRVKEYCSAKGISVHFLLAGDGEMRGQVERAAIDLELTDCLTITGYVSNMPMIYAAVDILMLTSDWEGTPMCILEAMSYALPTVAPSVGGIPDVITDGVTGLLFKRRNEEECFQQLIKMIESLRLRQEYGNNAYDFYENNLNYHSWAAQHIQYYESL